ncbi:MAG: site-specific DNA-methyltransferase [Candidatus Methanomethylicaceae archaeon]
MLIPEDRDYLLIVGDSREVLKSIPDGYVRCVVTSPPYFNLRDYGVDGQIGLEDDPRDYIAELVSIFREVRRILADDGTLWVNIGDTYAGSGRGTNDYREKDGLGSRPRTQYTGQKRDRSGLKPKDLIGIPWMLAFALRDDGWYLRQDIIWHKPNGIPESVRDRCTRTHEYIFLMTKSSKYYYNSDRIREPYKLSTIKRALRGQNPGKWGFEDSPQSKTKSFMEHARENVVRQFDTETVLRNGFIGNGGRLIINPKGRNKPSVWSVPSCVRRNGIHYAAFPEKLIEPCILAGSDPGDVVLDPFCGIGTTGVVALRHGRKFIGCDINPEYIEYAEKRILEVPAGLFR